MDNAILYVRSKKISLGENPGLAGHYGDVATYTGPAAASPNCYYDSQDQEAINRLNRSGIAYADGFVQVSLCIEIESKVEPDGGRYDDL